MERLIEILKESAELYENFIELEYKKYDVVIKNDIETLDELVSKEQVFYLKIRGLEQKREKLLDSLGMKNMTFKEIIDSMDEGNTKIKLQEQYDNLNSLILEVKKISSLCKTLVEVRLHRIDNLMSRLGEIENTYSRNEVKNGNAKSLLLSKKI